MSTDLITFVRARLDDVERDARMAASAAAGTSWRLADDGTVRGSDVASWVAGPHPMAAPHIVLHDPAWALADVAAKQRILDEIVPLIDQLDAQIESEWGSGISVPTGESGKLLRLLALPYSAHPDYREEWRP